MAAKRKPRTATAIEMMRKIINRRQDVRAAQQEVKTCEDNLSAAKKYVQKEQAGLCELIDQAELACATVSD